MKSINSKEYFKLIIISLLSILFVTMSIVSLVGVGEVIANFIKNQNHITAYEKQFISTDMACQIIISVTFMLVAVFTLLIFLFKKNNKDRLVLTTYLGGYLIYSILILIVNYSYIDYCHILNYFMGMAVSTKANETTLVFGYFILVFSLLSIIFCFTKFARIQSLVAFVSLLTTSIMIGVMISGDTTTNVVTILLFISTLILTIVIAISLLLPFLVKIKLTERKPVIKDFHIYLNNAKRLYENQLITKEQYEKILSNILEIKLDDNIKIKLDKLKLSKQSHLISEEEYITLRKDILSTLG